MCQYSEIGLYNTNIFLDGTYSLIIFFEDNKKDYFYEGFLERLLGDNKEKVCIRCLNGKDSLIEKYKETQKNHISKYIFVVDGDFDLLLENEMIQDENFIYLSKYNIESYLLQKESVIKYVRGKIRKSRNEVEKLMEYDLWYQNILEKLGEVCIWSALIKKYTNEKVIRKNIIESQTGDVSLKIKEEQFLIVQKIDEYEKKLEYLKERIKSLYNNDYSYIICGKILINSLVGYLKNKIKCTMRHDDLIQFLLNDISLNDFLQIKLTVEKNLNTSS